MKKFGVLSAIVALGSLSLALAKPVLPPVPEKEKAAAQHEQLAPKMVKLNLTNVSVLDAVAELSRQSGYNLQLTGDRTPFASRMITLQTGEVSFFQALDMLCAKGGLVEKNLTGPTTGPIRPQPVPLPPVPAPNPGVRPNIKVRPAPVPPVPQDGNPGAPEVEPGIQIQVQPVPVQPLPVQPGAKILPAPVGGRVPPANQQIQLADGKPVEAPTFYAGAVRIRVLPATSVRMNVLPGEALLVFEVTAEPRMYPFNIVGTPTITKAIDDLGQTLTPVNQFGNPMPGKGLPGGGGPNLKVPLNLPNVPLPPNAQPALPPLPPAPPGAPVQIQPALPVQAQPLIAQPGIRFNNNLTRIVTVRMKLGNKQATMIKELTGTLSVQFQGQPEAVATIDNVMMAKGQSAKSKNNDVTMILDSIEKVGDVYRAAITMEQQAGPPVRGGGGVAPGLPGVAPGAPGVGPAVPVPPVNPNPAPPGRAIPAPAIPPNPAPAQVQVQNGAAVAFPPIVAPGSSGLPSLVDAQGKVYQAVNVGGVNVQPPIAPGAPIRRTYTIEYRANAGQGQPARLVLNQTRMVTVPIDFTFNNVPLR